MRKNFSLLFVVTAALVVSSGCNFIKGGNSPTGPSSSAPPGFTWPNMTKSFDVAEASATPGDGATLYLGTSWKISYHVWCNIEGGRWGFYFIRDDGAVSIDNSTTFGCQGRERGANLDVLQEGRLLYKFGREHKVTVKIAAAPDSDSFYKGLNLIVSDRDVVTWFIKSAE